MPLLYRDNTFHISTLITFLMLCRLCCFCPVSNIRSFQTNVFLTGWDCHPHTRPPTWTTRVCFFVWVITLDLTGMWCHTSSYSIASITLRIIWPRKPHLYVTVGIPSVGYNSYKNSFHCHKYSKKHHVLKASSGETTQLKKKSILLPKCQVVLWVLVTCPCKCCSYYP